MFILAELARLFEYLFIHALSDKKGRQELRETIEWETQQGERMNKGTQEFIDAMDEIMADSTTNLLNSHRKYQQQICSSLSR